MKWLLKLLGYRKEKRKNGKNRFICNIKKDVEDVRDYRVGITTTEMPVRFSLEKYLPLIRNQGAIGSCRSHSIVGCMETMRNIQGKHRQVDLSELFHYYVVRDKLEQTNEDTDNDSGQSMRDGIDIAYNIGICSEELWNYDWTKYKIKPPNLTYIFAKLFKIKTYYRCWNILDIKQRLLQNKPVDFGIMVDKDFLNNTKEFIYSINKNNYYGGHAMYIYGYDDEMEVVFVRNSWGMDWGLYGNCKIKYDVLMEHLISAWSYEI